LSLVCSSTAMNLVWMSDLIHRSSPLPTVIHWVKQVGKRLPDAPAEPEIPETAQVDELQTFVGAKKQTLVVGSRQHSSSGNSLLGLRRPQCSNLLGLMVNCAGLGLLFVHHGWLPGLPLFH